jgi:TPR repeat protein
MITIINEKVMEKLASNKAKSGHELLGCAYYGVIIGRAAEPSKRKEAVKWLFQASKSGHVRAQYQLALCLHQGCGFDRHLHEAVSISLFVPPQICGLACQFRTNELFSQTG